MLKAERLLYHKMKREIFGPGYAKADSPRNKKSYWRLYRILEGRYENWMRNKVANEMKVGEDVTGKDVNVKVVGGVPSGFVDEPDKYDDFAYVPANPVALGLVETEHDLS
jgi:hypothetical protein